MTLVYLAKFVQKQKWRLALCSQVLSVSRTVPGTEQDRKSTSRERMRSHPLPPVRFLPRLAPVPSRMLGPLFLLHFPLLLSPPFVQDSPSYSKVIDNKTKNIPQVPWRHLVLQLSLSPSKVNLGLLLKCRILGGKGMETSLPIPNLH